MNVLENICPVCKHENRLDASSCSRCGAALKDPYQDPGSQTQTTDIAATAPESRREWSIVVDPITVPRDGLAVYVEGASGPAHIDSRPEFVLGRRVATTSGALLDLSPLGGYHMGLSRRHAIIRRTEHGYEVLDLGSVNGTWLNDARLAPHRAYPLASGSYLRLGRMRLYVFYHPFGDK
jgi:pSer/pThr/pTyr-binding forkhead associated (FHA) protein